MSNIEKEDLSAAQSVLGKFTHGNTPSSSNVPFDPSHSGNQKSGSGQGGSGGGDVPRNGGNSSSQPNSPRQKALTVIMVVCAICTCIIAISSVFIAYKSTSPEGLTQTIRLSEFADKEGARKHAETMADKKIKLTQLEQKKSLAKASTSPPPGGLVCTMISEESTRKNPVRATPGECFIREQDSSNVWMIFDRLPQKIDGVIAFNPAIFAKNADGSNGQSLYDTCRSAVTTDHCFSYLKQWLGVPLMVMNTGRIQITM